MTEPVVLPASARWTIPGESATAGLRVSLAMPMTRSKEPVRALLVLDGDSLFHTATEFVRTVRHVTMGHFPQVAVIGVVRDEPHGMQYVASRFRDFTPQQWTLTGPFADDNAMATMGTGGATEFLASIEQQVLPQVRTELSASGHDLGEIAIGGWSLSGLFASWAWMQRPDLFPHLLSISPSLWWHDASILDERFGARPSTHKVFVCSGEHEEGDTSKVYPQKFANAAQREMAAMVRNAARFGVLAAATGADVDSVAFPGEHHITVQAAALARGLRHIYG